MLKRIAALMLVFLLLASLAGCGKKKTVHCDRCGEAIEIGADSNMDEDWIIFCGDCEEEIGPIVE